jgi:hypothetical protein
LRKIVVKRDVRFEENRALRKAYDIGAAAATGYQELETRKIEEVHGTGVCTGTGAGTDDQTADQDEEQ